MNIKNNTFNLIAEIANSDPNTEVRVEAQEGIKSLFPGGVDGFEELLKKFVDGLRETDNKEKQQIAALALAGMGEMAIPHLTPLLEDEDPKIRQIATRVLVMIEQDQREILVRNNNESA